MIPGWLIVAFAGGALAGLLWGRRLRHDLARTDERASEVRGPGIAYELTPAIRPTELRGAFTRGELVLLYHRPTYTDDIQQWQ